MSGTYTNANLSDTAGPEPGVDSENLVYSEVKSCLYSQNTGRNTIATKSINFSPPGEGGDNKRDKIRMANYRTVKPGSTHCLGMIKWNLLITKTYK